MKYIDRNKLCELGKTLNASFMTVTPEQAQIWLDECNSKNRPVSREGVKNYAIDMVSNKWIPTSQGIGFTKDGRLTNGQHRLLAIIKSGVSVCILVSVGLPEEAFDNEDTGRPRGNGQILALHDVRNANVVSAIIGNVRGYTNTKDKPNYMGHNLAPQKNEVNNVYAKDPEALQEATKITHLVKSAGNEMPSSTFIAALYYILAKIDKNKATKLFEDIIELDNVAKKDPAYKAHKALALMKREKQGGNAVGRMEMAYIIFSAWNLRLTKRVSLKAFKVGVSPTPVPFVDAHGTLFDFPNIPI